LREWLDSPGQHDNLDCSSVLDVGKRDVCLVVVLMELFKIVFNHGKHTRIMAHASKSAFGSGAHYLLGLVLPF
jgi:hypothetical protein